MLLQQYVLIDQAFQEKVLKDIAELKILIASKKEPRVSTDNIRWFDNPELMEYLHISRRTTLTLRKHGLPFTRIDGKIYYRKDLVDAFLTEHQIRENK